MCFTVSGMGVGSNPATWFVAVVFLIVIRFLIDLRKGTNMKTLNFVKSGLLLAAFTFVETFWAIATNIVAGLVTPSIHMKGAPRLG